MTANPDQGWRIKPKPGTTLRRTEAGRFALPLEITFNGEHKADVEHVYTGDEIESIYAQMRELYAQGAMVPPAEDRRQLKADMGRFY